MADCRSIPDDISLLCYATGDLALRFRGAGPTTVFGDAAGGALWPSYGLGQTRMSCLAGVSNSTDPAWTTATRLMVMRFFPLPVSMPCRDGLACGQLRHKTGAKPLTSVGFPGAATLTFRIERPISAAASVRAVFGA